ncbi:thiol-disulfide oxidoreductase DCC family protein [Shimia haliotis]|uniref:Predicted thiol-disulfide oxidoreductase YuxK, DCC family n=1 Tax=Shimia haliotis TaxID=1280847 RepID=A0A1I4DVM2_9RHOB|nr:DCC1-like thiol-disulfide oxidoreductase family protein [Shimia haliotis]SFK97465.1 Predicted thiol-disulfide oxidoreductase YuxK, DCC family [Shimia haliotis]
MTMRPVAREAYSYEAEVGCGWSDRSRVLLVMDGDCALCSRAARFIAAHDSRDCIRITTAQGPLGWALLSHYGLAPDDPESWLLIEDGKAWGSLQAILLLAPRLHWAFRALAPLTLLPLWMQDWLYARIARNRYAMFGRDDLCALPDDVLKRRLVS